MARAVLDQLPHEPVLYVGDTARGPYGPRPIPEVRAFALDVMDHLVDQGVKLLVIACNSASAAVLRDARERYDVPVVEVIQPAVRRAVRSTRNRRIGVIGTRATIETVAHEYLDPVVDADVDTLILGCTHYPLLTGVISYVMGEDVTLVSSAEQTAQDVYRTLVSQGLERDAALPEPEHRFLATGDPAPFATLARRFLGPEVVAVEHATEVIV